MDNEMKKMGIVQWVYANPRAAIVYFLIYASLGAILLYIGWTFYDRIRGGKVISTLLMIVAFVLSTLHYKRQIRVAKQD